MVIVSTNRANVSHCTSLKKGALSGHRSCHIQRACRQTSRTRSSGGNQKQRLNGNLHRQSRTELSHRSMPSPWKRQLEPPQHSSSVLPLPPRANASAMPSPGDDVQRIQQACSVRPSAYRSIMFPWWEVKCEVTGAGHTHSQSCPAPFSVPRARSRFRGLRLPSIAAMVPQPAFGSLYILGDRRCGFADLLQQIRQGRHHL